MAEMTQEREAKILQDAVDVYGTDSQIGVAIEEMSELTHALSRYQRAKREGKLDELHVRDILLEMADVQIMLNQLRLIFGDDVEEEIFKLERLERRLALPR